MGSGNSGNVELLGECGWDSSIRSILIPQGTVSCLNSLKFNFNLMWIEKCNLNSPSCIEIYRKSLKGTAKYWASAGKLGGHSLCHGVRTKPSLLVVWDGWRMWRCKDTPGILNHRSSWPEISCCIKVFSTGVRVANRFLWLNFALALWSDWAAWLSTGLC